MSLEKIYNKLMSHEVPRKDAIEIVTDTKISDQTRVGYLMRLYAAISGENDEELKRTLQDVDMGFLCQRIKANRDIQGVSGPKLILPNN